MTLTGAGSEVVRRQTYWEAAAKTRWGAYMTRREQADLDRAEELAGAPTQALEVGADGGRWSIRLRQRGWRVACTDVNRETLALCQKRIPDARCVLVAKTEQRLPVDDAAIQLLVAIEVPQVTGAAWFPAEAARALHPGGVLFTTVWNPMSARGRFYALIKRLGLRAFSAYTGPSYAAFRRSLQRSGFEVLSAHGLAWFPFTRQSNSRLIDKAAAVECWLGLSRLPRVSPLVLVTARRLSD